MSSTEPTLTAALAMWPKLYYVLKADSPLAQEVLNAAVKHRPTDCDVDQISVFAPVQAGFRYVTQTIVDGKRLVEIWSQPTWGTFPIPIAVQLNLSGTGFSAVVGGRTILLPDVGPGHKAETCGWLTTRNAKLGCRTQEQPRGEVGIFVSVYVASCPIEEQFGRANQASLRRLKMLRVSLAHHLASLQNFGASADELFAELILSVGILADHSTDDEQEFRALIDQYRKQYLHKSLPRKPDWRGLPDAWAKILTEI